ncbi:MAG: AHH domain-containing protein, partial [Planctomycetaceae bacterium]
ALPALRKGLAEKPELRKFVPDDVLRRVDGTNGGHATGARARQLLVERLGSHSFPVDAEAHHLFGVELFDSQIGRRLHRWGIDLNGPEYGVYLPRFDYPGRVASLHRGRTGGAYREEVVRRLSAAKSKAQALEILDDIRDDLLNGRLKINGAE